MNRKPPTIQITDKASSHQATVPIPKGNRAIMMIGEVNGIMLHHTARGLVGLPIALVIIMIEKMIGIVIGNIIA